MSKSRKRGQFSLVIVDRDKKVFNVIGPISGDSLWNERVLTARESGRDVMCYASYKSEGEIIKEHSSGFGHEYRKETIL